MYTPSYEQDALTLVNILVPEAAPVAKKDTIEDKEKEAKEDQGDDREDRMQMDEDSGEDADDYNYSDSDYIY